MRLDLLGQLALKSKQGNQNNKARLTSMATPAAIQKSAGLEVGRSTANTKLVEWPVVDNVPALADVLNKGHS